MNTSTSTQSQAGLLIPVVALSLFAIASGYLMSLIPLMLSQYGMEAKYASWLASAFYAGLLVGAGLIEPFVARLGHKNAFVLFLGLLAATIVILPAAPIEWIW
ncbi:MFS transporter, partial [Aliivibrio sifiae]